MRRIHLFYVATLALALATTGAWPTPTSSTQSQLAADPAFRTAALQLPLLVRQGNNRPAIFRQNKHQGSVIFIRTVTDLQNIQNNLGGNYALAKNIDASGVDFTPIGPFYGTLDGNGFTISGLTIKSPVECYSITLCAGLFGVMEGTVSSLRLTNESVTVALSSGVFLYIGGIAGANRGQISNSFVQGTVSASEATTGDGGDLDVGGAIGLSEGAVSQLQANVAVISSLQIQNFAQNDVGGLIGVNESLVQESSAIGNVSSNIAGQEGSFIGGLIGETSTSGCVSHSYATGVVTGSGTGYSGGVAAGGLVGGTACGIDSSFASGAVSSTGDAGGLTGDYFNLAPKSISTSFATGSVSGAGNVGGLVGLAQSGEIAQSYSTGHIEGSGSLGGLVGFNAGTVVNDSYWDTQTSGIKASAGGTGLSTAKLTSGKLPAGFDTTIWEPMQFTAVQPALQIYPQLWQLSLPINSFPLAGLTPYTAKIITVFDHSLQTVPNSGAGALYSRSCDLAVLAFTGQQGQPPGQNEPTCDEAGYAQAGGGMFVLNGLNYTGDTSAMGGGKAYLNYEGHPGYDYGAKKYTPVYAAVSGTLFYPWNVIGTGSATFDTYCRFHTLAEVPDAAPAYRIYYLHLSTHPASSTPGSIPLCKTSGMIEPFSAQSGCYSLAGQPTTPTSLPLPTGTHVNAGCEIALSGDAGVPGAPHLHFEIQQIVPASAYAIKPNPAIAYFRCWDENSHYANKTTSYCLPADPYGWTGGASNCPSNPAQWVGDIWQCLTNIPGRRLWVQ